MHVVSAPVLEGWTCLSDEQIVVRVVAGQTALFEVLMRRHNERVYRAARSIVKDESEAEDVMQQAYVNAIERAVVLTRRSRIDALSLLAASTFLALVGAGRCSLDGVIGRQRALA